MAPCNIKLLTSLPHPYTCLPNSPNICQLGSKPPSRQRRWGCSCGSCTSFLWKTSSVALGAFWPIVGEMAVTILSSAKPHWPPCPWPACLVFVPLSPDGKAGRCAHCLTHPCSLSGFLIHGPGLSCFTFISSCSPISLSTYKPYFYAAWADLDMKLA